VLPIGAGLAAFFGIILGFPVLRLRGDYLAIVTLGFGEIIRLIWKTGTNFPSAPAVSPTFPGRDFSALKLS
jgi:branched-chain amino acid transport system permease protein